MYKMDCLGFLTCHSDLAIEKSSSPSQVHIPKVQELGLHLDEVAERVVLLHLPGCHLQSPLTALSFGAHWPTSLLVHSCTLSYGRVVITIFMHSSSSYRRIILNFFQGMRAPVFSASESSGEILVGAGVVSSCRSVFVRIATSSCNWTAVAPPLITSRAEDISLLRRLTVLRLASALLTRVDGTFRRFIGFQEREVT